MRAIMTVVLGLLLCACESTDAVEALESYHSAVRDYDRQSCEQCAPDAVDDCIRGRERDRGEATARCERRVASEHNNDAQRDVYLCWAELTRQFAECSEQAMCDDDALAACLDESYEYYNDCPRGDDQASRTRLICLQGG